MEGNLNMANWQRKIDLSEEFGRIEDFPDKDGLSKLCNVIADKLEKLNPYSPEYEFEEEKKEIIQSFRDLAEDKDITVENFDSLMTELYNWGDTSIDGKFGGKKVCWINT